MLILTATNVTPDGLVREDGTADYEVWVGINQRCLWRGSVNRHRRDAGAAELLRLIATRMDDSGLPKMAGVQVLSSIPGAALAELKERAAGTRNRRSTVRFSDLERSAERVTKTGKHGKQRDNHKD